MRQILRIDVQGVGLVGTCHEPSGAARGMCSPPRIGVVLFALGSVTRAGASDLGAATADRLCELGYPVFRVDFPGLGDTPGDLPAYFAPHYHFVEDGGHAPWAVDVVKWVRQRYGLSGVVLGGLCGGATTAILATERLGSAVRGLVLLEPAIRRTPPMDVATGAEAGPVPQRDGAVRRARQWLKARLRGSRLDPPLRWMYRVAYRLRGHEFTPDINAPLVRAWRKVTARGVPTLVLVASSPQGQLVRRYLFPPEPLGRVTIEVIEGTNHVLVAHGGKRRVADQIERWLLATCEPAKQAMVAAL